MQHGDSGWIGDVDLETEFAAAHLSRDCGEHGTVERDCLHGPAACIRINIECDFGASAGGAGRARFLDSGGRIFASGMSAPSGAEPIVVKNPGSQKPGSELSLRTGSLHPSQRTHLFASNPEPAKRLLVSTTQTLKEISFQLGYCDQFYFSSEFRRVTGMSPRETRRGKMPL